MTPEGFFLLKNQWLFLAGYLFGLRSLAVASLLDPGAGSGSLGATALDAVSGGGDRSSSGGGGGGSLVGAGLAAGSLGGGVSGAGLVAGSGCLDLDDSSGSGGLGGASLGAGSLGRCVGEARACRRKRLP